MKTASDRAVKPSRRLLASLSVAVLVLVTSAAFFSCSFTERHPQDPSVATGVSDWPHEGSDLSPDSTMTFGRLDNGLRYIIRQNQTPKDRVSMHLYVQVGSLFERDDEKGIAHFLEHMLFNGSKNFPPGEMIKYFQRIGMQFGPDANAHTGFDETVYDVLLSNNG